MFETKPMSRHDLVVNVVSAVAGTITLNYSLNYTQETSTYRHRTFALLALEFLVLFYMAQVALSMSTINSKYVRFGTQYLNVVFMAVGTVVAIMLVFVNNFTSIANMNIDFIVKMAFGVTISVAHAQRDAIKEKVWKDERPTVSSF